MKFMKMSFSIESKANAYYRNKSIILNIHFWVFRKACLKLKDRKFDLI